jgi:hypothetical protein
MLPDVLQSGAKGGSHWWSSLGRCWFWRSFHRLPWSWSFWRSRIGAAAASWLGRLNRSHGSGSGGRFPGAGRLWLTRERMVPGPSGIFPIRTGCRNRVNGEQSAGPPLNGSACCVIRPWERSGMSIAVSRAHRIGSGGTQFLSKEDWIHGDSSGKKENRHDSH